MEKEHALYEGEDDDSRVVIFDEIGRNSFHRTIRVITPRGDEGYLTFNNKKEITDIYEIKGDEIQKLEREDWMNKYFNNVRCVMISETMRKWLPSNFENLVVKLETAKKESYFG